VDIHAFNDDMILRENNSYGGILTFHERRCSSERAVMDKGSGRKLLLYIVE
jgi:hypothetical protein